MTSPQTPAKSRQASAALQKKKHDGGRNKRPAKMTARFALLTFLLLALGALAVLPGSSAATRRRAEAAPAPPEVAHAAPEAARAPGVSRESARVAPGLTSPATAATAAFFFQAAPESIATYESDCTTPANSFNLGETVCVNISGAPTSGAVVVLSDPDEFIRGNTLGVTESSQSFNFTLPSAANSGGVDNRGTWTVAIVNTEDNSRRVIARFFVHDPQQQVADVTISKTLLGSVVAGSNSTYRVFVTNQGPDAATNVSFTDHVMPNTTFVSFAQDGSPTFTCTTTAGQTTCTKASLAVGETASFTATYLVNAAVGDETNISDTVDVTSTTTDARPSSNSSTVETTASNPTPPACTLSCPANISVNAAEGQNGAVVAFDATVPGGTCGTVSTAPASGTFFPIGSTVVTSTSSSGQSCTFVVTVNAPTDTEAPSISCPVDISVNESSSSANSATVNYTVTATDNSGNVAVNCTPLASGSLFPVGTTEIVCTATDLAGNSTSCNFDVTVNSSDCILNQDSAAPTPKAASLPTITRACSATLLPSDDPAATDACGATVTGQITAVNGQPSDDRVYDVPGTYAITWTYTDAVGHSATQSQTVVILPDNSAPVPDEASLPTITGECSASITGDPPTATDNCGGSGMVGTALDPLTYTTPGTHVVRWQFTDTAGNSTIQNQTVIVTDGVAPVPVVASLPTLTGECSVTVTPPTATDNCGGTITAVTPDPTTYTAQGTYTVHWTYTDAAGNTATQNQTVVVDDNTAPTINITGGNSTTVECHTVYTDAGATATDNCPAAVTVTTTGNNVNTDVPGTYQVNYSALDAGGNTTTATRTVTVVDTTKPVITLNGANPMTVILGSAYVEPGATAADSCAGTFAATPSGAVNTNAIGTYTITYNATDPSNNAAVPVTRTVNVIYDFTGFFSPVNNNVINQVTAGRSVPVKFSLAGNQGLGILAAGSPYSQQVTCGSNTVSDLEETGTAGSSTLSYDAASDQYIYVWKTESSWAGTCRLLTVALADGTTHTATFKFK